MTKNELWKMVQDAKALQAEARKAWEGYITSLAHGPELFNEIQKIDMAALRAREAVIQAVAKEMIG